MIDDVDRKHLRRCVEQPPGGRVDNDPFGSVLVSATGEVLFEDHNQIAGGDPTQHPEFAIARWAAVNMSAKERAAATVYTSGEHCPMCAAALGWVSLGRIVYASSSNSLSNGLPNSVWRHRRCARSLSIGHRRRRGRRPGRELPTNCVNACRLSRERTHRRQSPDPCRARDENYQDAGIAAMM